jgi:hypothetical protein
MARPLLLAEPGPGDASCTIWTLSVFFRPFYYPAGRPSSRFTFDRFRSYDHLHALQVFRLSPCVSSLSTFFTRVRSYDLSFVFPTFRPSSLGSCLSTIFVRFRSYDLLHSGPVLRLSPCVSSLSAFFTRVRSYDLLRSLPVLRPSPFLLRSRPFGRWVSV